MKLTRRSFLGLLSVIPAIPFSPLVAKDMGDFQFLPPERKTPEVPKTFINIRPEPVIGQLRYNINTQYMEVYTSAGWQVLEDPINEENA